MNLRLPDYEHLGMLPIPTDSKLRVENKQQLDFDDIQIHRRSTDGLVVVSAKRLDGKHLFTVIQGGYTQPSDILILFTQQVEQI